MTSKIPNPGSDEALDLDCICPVMDNHHGKGFLWKDKVVFWYTEGCVLHKGATTYPPTTNPPDSP